MLRPFRREHCVYILQSFFDVLLKLHDKKEDKEKSWFQKYRMIPVKW